MKNTTELHLPLNYVDVDEEEMEYLDGGFYVDGNGVGHLDQAWIYSTRSGAKAAAIYVKAYTGWGRISLYDLTAEIYAHALLKYRGFALASRALGTLVGSKTLKGIYESCRSIELENRKDSRYWAFRAIYAQNIIV